MAFAVLGGILLAMGTGLLGRWLLGIPAAVLAAPLRRLGASGLLAAHRPGGEPLADRGAGDADHARGDARRHPGDRRVQQPAPHRGRRPRLRVHAPHVVVGADGAPLPAGTAAAVARLGGVDAVTAVVPTEIYPLDRRPRRPEPVGGRRRERRLDGEPRSTPAWSAGSLGDVHGDAVAVSRVFADGGDLRVGDTLPVRMADTTRATLRVAAIYDRAAGLGDVLLDPAVARRHAAVPADTALFVAGGAAAGRSLSRYASDHPGVRSLNRGAVPRHGPRVATSTGHGASGWSSASPPRSPRSR